VLGLGTQGWRIVSRRRFTQQGTALAWCRAEAERVRREQRTRWARVRASVVAVGGPETLETVCGECEDLRRKGDPSYTPLDE
jgi:hypothetical protein